VLARSWPVVTLSGCLVLGVTVLWMVRQAQYSGSLTAGGDGLDTGVGLAVAGGLLLFAGAFLMSELRRPRYGEPEVPPPDDIPEMPTEPPAPYPPQAPSSKPLSPDGPPSEP
jgi:hypothetical protein